MVLVAPQSDDWVGGSRALTLNWAGRAIWQLCDGTQTRDEMVESLSARFSVERDVVAGHLDGTLAKLSALGFLDDGRLDADGAPCTTFVIGIEDTTYFRWQTAILLESFSGKLPPGWKTLVVVCNDGDGFSDELSAILSRYGTAVASGRNHRRGDRIDIGCHSGVGYPAVNRVEALRVAADHVDAQDVICLIDSDTFLYGDLNRDIMPAGCAVPRNGHIASERFFSTVPANRGRGIDLDKLVEALGCESAFKPGGVNVFVSGEVAKNQKFIADCFRFAHAVYLLGRIAGAENVWMAEMPCFALAMTANGIAYELLERQELKVSDCTEETIPAGTIYHYYSDPADFGRTAFRDSRWYKHAYRHENFLAIGVLVPSRALFLQACGARE